MSTLKIIIGIAIIFFSFIRCGLTKYTISEYGDEATITLKNENNINCEIICFCDSSLIFTPIMKTNHGSKSQLGLFYRMKYKDIFSISIAGFNGDGWGTTVFLMQVVPAGLLAISASSVGTGALSVFAMSCIPAILTSLFFLSSEGETPEINFYTGSPEIDKMRIYARYPQGLNDEEMKALLKKSSQMNISEYTLDN